MSLSCSFNNPSMVSWSNFWYIVMLILTVSSRPSAKFIFIFINNKINKTFPSPVYLKNSAIVINDSIAHFMAFNFQSTKRILTKFCMWDRLNYYVPVCDY